MRFQKHHNLIANNEGQQVCNTKNCVDGYNSSAMLFTEEDKSQTQLGGTQTQAPTHLKSLHWRPVVRFDSKHFVYKWDKTRKQPFIAQHGVSCDLNMMPSNI
jgi:hypothetical protein